ncbi:hypothetical protein EFQ23_01225 [Limosilactobacillus fermentum]|nr:hypothetical protein [Limosilactobacillus fermentum]PPX65791.1 hypothetical protein C5O28_05145 [Limosilactobacillus fermentum]
MVHTALRNDVLFKIGLVSKGCARKQKEKKPATSTFLGILKRNQKENPLPLTGGGFSFYFLSRSSIIWRRTFKSSLCDLLFLL